MLKHVAKVEVAAATYSERGMIAFAAACCERQLPVYERVGAVAEWGHSETLRKILNYVWSWLSEEEVSPPVYDFDEAIPPDEPVEGGDAAMNVAGMFDLLLKLPADYDAQSVGWVAENGLNLLDALLYEVLDLKINSANDEVVHNHELIKLEIGRQEQDLSLVRDGLTANECFQLRQQSVGRSIFGKLWYP